MAFELYEQTRAITGEESVSITSVGMISFSAACVQKYLKDVVYVQAYFDSATKRIGIKPAKENDEYKFKLSRPENSNRALFSGRGFLRNYKIMDGDKFKAATFTVKFENGMITFAI